MGDGNSEPGEQGLLLTPLLVVAGLVGAVAACVAAVALVWKQPMRIALHSVVQVIQGLVNPSAALDPPAAGDTQQPHNNHQRDAHPFEQTPCMSVGKLKASPHSPPKAQGEAAGNAAAASETAATGAASMRSPGTSSSSTDTTATTASQKQQPPAATAGLATGNVVRPTPQRRRRRRQLPTPRPSKAGSTNSLAVARSPTNSITSVRSGKRSLPPTPRGATPVRHKSPQPGTGTGGFSPLVTVARHNGRNGHTAHTSPPSQPQPKDRSPLAQAHGTAMEQSQQQRKQTQTHGQKAPVDDRHFPEHRKAQRAQHSPAYPFNGGAQNHTSQAFGFDDPKHHRFSSPAMSIPPTSSSATQPQDARKRRVRFSDPVTSPLPPAEAADGATVASAREAEATPSHKQGSKKSKGKNKGRSKKTKSFKWPKLFGRKAKNSPTRTAAKTLA